MLLSLSLVFNVVLVVCVVSLFKKWWEADDDLKGCERQLEKCEECLDEWQKAYRSLQCDYYYLEEDLFDTEAEFEEFQDKTVKVFKQLKNELQDREDLIANLFEEMEELEADDEPETIEVEDYEVMPELLFLMAPIVSEAEKMVADAKIEADKIVAEAKAKADQIIANAEIKIKEMLSKVNKYKKPVNKPVPPQVSVKDPNKEYKKPTGKPVKPTINKAV